MDVLATAPHPMPTRWPQRDSGNAGKAGPSGVPSNLVFNDIQPQNGVIELASSVKP